MDSPTGTERTGSHRAEVHIAETSRTSTSSNAIYRKMTTENECAEYTTWLCSHCDEANARKCASYTPLVKVKDEVKPKVEVKEYKQLKLFEL